MKKPSLIKKLGYVLARNVLNADSADAKASRAVYSYFENKGRGGLHFDGHRHNLTELQTMFNDALYDAAENFQNVEVTSDSEIQYSRKKKVDRKKKTYYNEFSSYAMQWARSNSTQVGDTTILNNNGKYFSLIQKTEDGWIVLKNGNYGSVKEYEERYREPDNSIHVYTDIVWNAKGSSNTNDVTAENSGKHEEGSEPFKNEKFRSDSTRNNEYLFESDNGKQLKKSIRDNVHENAKHARNGISLSESVIEYMSANGYDVDALFEKAAKKFKYYTLEHRSRINNSSLSVASKLTAQRQNLRRSCSAAVYE